MSYIYSVYMHVNKENDKKYIGITCQRPEERWGKGHGYIDCPAFYKAIKKYGWDGFYHVILITSNDEHYIKDMEISLIALFNTTNRLYGYNISRGGDGCRKYIFQSDLQRKQQKAKYDHDRRIRLIDHIREVKKEYNRKIKEQKDKEKEIYYEQHKEEIQEQKKQKETMKQKAIYEYYHRPEILQKRREYQRKYSAKYRCTQKYKQGYQDIKQKNRQKYRAIRQKYLEQHKEEIQEQKKLKEEKQNQRNKEKAMVKRRTQEYKNYRKQYIKTHKDRIYTQTNALRKKYRENKIQQIISQCKNKREEYISAYDRILKGETDPDKAAIEFGFKSYKSLSRYKNRCFDGLPSFTDAVIQRHKLLKLSEKEKLHRDKSNALIDAYKRISSGQISKEEAAISLGYKCFSSMDSVRSQSFKQIPCLREISKIKEVRT